MMITYTKKGGKFVVKVVFRNGTTAERLFPEMAVSSIMKIKGLTEKGAVEYLAVHRWVGLEDGPAPRKTPQTLPAGPTRPLVALPPPPQPLVLPVPTAAPKAPPTVPAPPAKVKDATVDDLLEELEDNEEDEDEEEEEEAEEEGEEEEEPSEEDWEDYNWLMEQARRLEYFSRPGIQSKKKEDLQKWLRKELKK